ncbi:metal-dependent hydrolase [Paenibacillus sp. KS-LC4]|uniref:metal-dependent hydrolase n=1 Tax=Paenibacillus sp. KS-LC4 TaxID=2979727 RepID=UPI0030D1F601
MKGTTHLTIGMAIGAGAAAYYSFTPANAAAYVAVAAISALSADLDGPSILSSKLGKVSKLIHDLLIWGGVIMIAIVSYLYVVNHTVGWKLLVASIGVVLLGLVAKRGFIRNALVSVIGGAFVYGGFWFGMNWLIGLGAFVAVAPWLKHRGMTHTVWAAAAWGAIAWGLEQQLHLEGIMRVAIIGYLSHLFADTLTPSGVKWLYPLYKKPFKLSIF